MRSNQELNEAKEFLEKELREGARDAKDLLSTSRAVGISLKALQAAAKELHVDKFCERPGHWTWSLPDKDLDEWLREIEESFGQPNGFDEKVDVEAIADLLKLSGVEFEQHIAELLGRLGFCVELTAPTGDGGIDIVALSRHPITGGRYLVQCKRFAPGKPVGSAMVREFYGALRADQRAIKGIFITTSAFTSEAFHFAESLPLELIDGARLLQLLHGNSKAPQSDP